jgi:hypothetical protein
MHASDTGRTVGCTIHQPSIDIFEMWHGPAPMAFSRVEAL